MRRFLLRGCRAFSSQALAEETRVIAASGGGFSDHWRRVACVALLGVAGTGVAASESSPSHPRESHKGWHLLSLAHRRQLFFKYEKRIREMSPQEKVFDYFASQQDPATGSVFMLAGDMLRAVVPVYPPEGSPYVRSGALAGEPNPEVPTEESAFFESFDIDGDGRISFEEYRLYTTLLAIPSEDIEVAFKVMDTDSSGKVDAREFGRLLDSMHSRMAHPTHTARRVGHSDDRDARSGLLVRFFGRDGSRELTLQEFSEFLARLREELVRLEFKYYDYQGRGYMTGRDFAYSIAGSASFKYIDEYLNKARFGLCSTREGSHGPAAGAGPGMDTLQSRLAQVHDMPAELAESRVTLRDLQAFREVWRQLRSLAVALEFVQNTSATGTVTPADFEFVTQNILQQKITKEQVAVVFYLFGSPERGLNVHHMHKVMSHHCATGLKVVYEYEGDAEQGGGGKKSMLECIRECHAR